MVDLPIASPSRKGTFQWLARGVASHLTRGYVTRFAASRSAAVCGYPRSGTSWVSEVLAEYYDIPCHRHYTLPKLHPQVLHTHDLDLGTISRVFYILRAPYTGYVSLFVKRYGIIDPLAAGDPQALRKRFAKFLRQEIARPHESPCRWSDHVAGGVARFGIEAVIPYAKDPREMLSALSARIGMLEERVESHRLARLLTGASPDTPVPTTRTSSAARQFAWYDNETRAIVADEVERLHRISPQTSRFQLTEAGE